jgi:antitoxin StbD
MDAIFSHHSVSVTELKREYASILLSAADEPVAVLNHNRPEAYLLSAAYYEQLLSTMEDMADAQLVKERLDGPYVEVNILDL